MSYVDAFNSVPDDDPPDRLGIGSYDAEIVAARETTTRSGKPAFRFTFSSDGKLAWLTQLVHKDPSAKGFFFFKELMMRLGITPAMLDADPVQAIESVVGRKARILISERGEWKDVKVVHMLEPGEVAGVNPF